jgi:hypothetical protein
MKALQSIIKEAKAIRKKMPKIEWKKAVAQASAIYASKHKGKSPVGKKKAVKKAAKKKAVGKYVKTVKKGKITNVVYKRKKIGAVKKATTMHKDTKSHNVNIRVMSGLNTLNTLKDQISLLNKYQSFYDHYMKMSIKERPKLQIKQLKSLIKETKIHIAQLKKHI